VDRAHKTAREALSKIPSEEQKERVNIWSVLLRMEVKYFGGKIDAGETLTEACGNCDDYVMVNNMATIYEEEGVTDVSTSDGWLIFIYILYCQSIFYFFFQQTI